MKKLIALLIPMLLLAACSSEPPKVEGTFENVKVVKTEEQEHCIKGCWSEYYITFEKNGTKVKLYSDNENTLNVLQKGSVVNVSYSSDFEIIKVTFPTMQDTKTNEQ